MFCRNCGKEINDTTIFCPYCGTQVSNDAEPVKVNLGFDNPTQKKLSMKALVGFIVAMAGILLAAIPCGIVGLIFSCLGKKETEKSNLGGRGFAIAGIVVSILDIVFGVIAIIMMFAFAEAYLSLFSYL